MGTDVERRERLRRMGPLSADHPLVTGESPRHRECPACARPFAAGDWVTLIMLGPGIDAEDRAACRAGRVYNAAAVPIHWACATGDEGPP